jgi:hypothetical protein
MPPEGALGHGCTASCSSYSTRTTFTWSLPWWHSPTRPATLHRSLGFTEVGTLDEVGFKFGAYVSTTSFQLRLR